MGEGPEIDAFIGIKRYSAGGLAKVAKSLVGESPVMIALANTLKSSGRDDEFVGEGPALDLLRSL